MCVWRGGPRWWCCPAGDAVEVAAVGVRWSPVCAHPARLTGILVRVAGGLGGQLHRTWCSRRGSVHGLLRSVGTVTGSCRWPRAVFGACLGSTRVPRERRDELSGVRIGRSRLCSRARRRELVGRPGAGRAFAWIGRPVSSKHLGFPGDSHRRLLRGSIFDCQVGWWSAKGEGSTSGSPTWEAATVIALGVLARAAGCSGEAVP